MVQREKMNSEEINENRIPEIEKEITDSDIIELSHELTYRRFLLSDGKIRSFFQKLTIPEYLSLHNIK